MKRVALSILVTAVGLAACGGSDPVEMTERRNNAVQRVFPNPADQQGIHLAFPIDTGLNVVYLPDHVTQSDVDRRVSFYCERIEAPQMKFSRLPEKTSVTLSDGGSAEAVSVWYDCE